MLVPCLCDFGYIKIGTVVAKRSSMNWWEYGFSRSADVWHESVVVRVDGE